MSDRRRAAVLAAIIAIVGGLYVTGIVARMIVGTTLGAAHPVGAGIVAGGVAPGAVAGIGSISRKF